MTEEEARAAIDVSRETLERIENFVGFLAHENERQNLVSRGSLDSVWARHIVDSAQLVRFAPPDAGSWLDLGSGAGFPGLVAATLHPAAFELVESRRLRVEFLVRAAEILGVSDRVRVTPSRAELLPARPYDVISARAFAPLEKLLAISARFAGENTTWILPKGKNAKSELEAARASWQGDFHLEPSLTDPDAQIIVARRVRRKPVGKGTR